jgi:pimeloyl-ACP methyl ester carboxylesterase
MTTRFVETSLLRIGYEVAGPDGGFPVILAHGWPDDARTWDPVLPAGRAGTGSGGVCDGA